MHASFDCLMFVSYNLFTTIYINLKYVRQKVNYERRAADLLPGQLLLL